MDASKAGLENLPKIELHAHLSGSLSEECLKKLICNSDLPKEKINKLMEPLQQKSLADRSLTECFKIFDIIHQLTSKLEAVRQMTEYTLKEFADDKVKYLELRTTPKCVPGSYSKSDYIKTVLDTIIASTSDDEMMVRLLLSIDRARGVSDAEDTLKLTNEIASLPMYRKYLVGFDLSGNPDSGSLKDYVHVIEEAKQANYKITGHLVEVKSDIAFEEAFKLINLNLIDRIGHGTYIHPKCGGNAELYGIIRAKNIPFEICLTSNILCGTVDRIENHHVKYMLEDGHPFVICTDDKGVFGTTLTKEMEKFSEVFGASRNDLLKMLNLAANVAFLSDEDKDILRINIGKLSP